MAGAAEVEGVAVAGADGAASVTRVRCGRCFGARGCRCCFAPPGEGEVAAAGAAWGTPWFVSLSFEAFEPATEVFVCEIGPLCPRLRIRATTTTLPAESCVAVALDSACWPVAADWPDPAEPPWGVDAEFEASDVATLTFVCVIGPSSPVLLIRTITTMFVGCCWVAVAEELAPWSVVATTSPDGVAGRASVWGGDSDGVPAAASAGTNPLQMAITTTVEVATSARRARLDRAKPDRVVDTKAE